MLQCLPSSGAELFAWITLVVPFAAGGTTDIVARAVGQKLGEALQQTVVIDNRAGAGGTLGAASVVKAPADGYTLLMATVAHTMAPGLYKPPPYDFSKDLDDRLHQGESGQGPPCANMTCATSP